MRLKKIGKIIGVGLVGLTQLVIWLVLIPIILTFVSTFLGTDILADSNSKEAVEMLQKGNGNDMVMLINEIKNINWALIVPSFANLKDWYEKNNIPYRSNEDAVKDPKVLAHYKEIVEGMNQFFNHVEQVKRFELLPREWTIDSGEITPKMSLKRKVIMEKHKDSIERIYAS